MDRTRPPSPNLALGTRPLPPSKGRSACALLAALALLAAGVSIPDVVAAQMTAVDDGEILPPAPERERPRMRVGLMIGGTNLVGMTVEYRRGDWAGEVTVGTLSLGEITTAVAGKRYLGSGQLQPVAGLGLWGILARGEEGTGAALILRAPLAVDWEFAGSHAMGLELSLNRALHVRRMDPENEEPPRTAIVPIPGFYYRFGWNP